MAIEFRCSQCSQLLRVPDDSAGKHARCPKCQSLMTVPAASQPGASQPATPLAGGSPFSPLTPSSGPGQPPPAADPFAFLNQPGGAGGAMPPPPADPFAGLRTPPPPKPVGNSVGDGGFPPAGANPYASSPVPQGYGMPQGYGPPGQQNPAPMLLAVGSLMTALMGLMTCACCLFLPFPAISLTLGVIALCLKPDKNAKIIAIIGIVLSALSLILIVVGMIVGVVSASMDPQFRQGLGN